MNIISQIRYIGFVNHAMSHKSVRKLLVEKSSNI